MTDFNSLSEFKNSIDNAKLNFENALDSVSEVISDPNRSNFEAWDIIQKILDIAPFIIRMFPEFKDKLLSVLIPVHDELTDLIDNLK